MVFYRGVLLCEKREDDSITEEMGYSVGTFICVLQITSTEASGLLFQYSYRCSSSINCNGGGYCLPPIRIPCDITYEIFLYHWIVLNIIVHFDLINKLSWCISLIILSVATFTLAWLSWRFIGKGRYKCKTKISISNKT